MTKKTASLIVKIIVSIGILVFLFTRVEFNSTLFKETLINLNIPIYLLSLFGVIIVLGIKSIRWNMLVLNEGFDYKRSRSFGAYMSSDAIGIVTPGRIGEIARLYYVRQETSIPFFLAFKTIVSDRIFDFTMLGWFGISGLTYYFKTFGDISGIAYVVIILVSMLVLYIASMTILSFVLNKNWFSRWDVPRFFFECFRAVIGKKAVAMWSITILAYLGYFFFSWLIMLALNVKPGLVHVAFIMSIMSLSTIIPISVAGFGTREATLVLLFAYYGIASETAISFSILHFTAFFLWGGIIGLFYWMVMPISLKQVKEDSIHIFNLLKVQPKEVKTGEK
jgi:glycosyltransferase 2 family protein